MKNSLLILFSFLFISASYSQSITQKLSANPMKVKAKISSDIIGEMGENLLIAVSNNYNFSPDFVDEGCTKIELALFNKKNYNLVKSVPLLWGLKKRMHEDIKFSVCRNIYIIDNQIYVFWERRTVNSMSFKVQILDKNLNETKAPTTVYELPCKIRDYNSAVFFCFQSPDKQTIIIGGEESAERKENIRVQYKVYDKNFSVIQSVQASLPFYKKGRAYGTTSIEYLPDNYGNIYYSTVVKDRSRDKAYVLGKIQAENSTSSELYLPINILYLNDIKLLVQDHEIKGFATTSKGLLGFTIDIATFTLKDGIIENNFDASKVTFSDYSKSLSKASIETSAFKNVLNNDLIINNIKVLPNNKILLTLSNTYYYEVCNKSSCVPHTKFSGQHYAMIAKDGSLEWLAFTKQKFNKTSYYHVDEDVIVTDKYMYTSLYGSNIIHTVDINSGKVSSRTMPLKYKFRIVDIENNHMYFTEYKTRKSPATVIASAAILGAAATYGIISKKYVPAVLGGLFLGYCTYYFGKSHSNMYIGEFILSK